MTEKEKVINGLECCSLKECIMKYPKVECPHIHLMGDCEDVRYECTSRLAADALALLKQYEESWKRVKYSVIDAQMSTSADDEKTYEACKRVVELMDREEKRWKDA